MEPLSDRQYPRDYFDPFWDEVETEPKEPDKQCEYCGEEYIREDSDSDNPSRFCSAGCEDNWFIENATDSEG